MKEQSKQKKRKQNMKIYTLYRTLGIDVLFYYGISFLFLTEVKGISAAHVVLADVFYSAFRIFLQIPANLLIQKLGTRKCTILGNLFNLISMIIILFCTNFWDLVISYLLSALCFALKDVSDTSLLNFSIPKAEKKGEIFSKLEGKANKNYYYLNAITSIASGPLYLINPYIPVVIATLITGIALFISLGFSEIQEKKKKEKSQSGIQIIKEELGELKDGFQFIFHSQRLKSLILYSGVIWGIIALLSNYRSSILADLNVSAMAISVIYALIYMVCAIGTNRQLQFHNHFRNKSLSIILITIVVCTIVCGVAGILPISVWSATFVISIAYCLVYAGKGIYGVISQRYLANFSNEEILPKIYSANAVSQNVFRTVINLIGSYLLGITNTANAMILAGIMFTLVTIGVLSYMKTRVGLKPSQYAEEEINYQKKKKIVEHSK